MNSKNENDCTPANDCIPAEQPSNKPNNLIVIQYIGYGLLCLFFLKYLFFVVLVVISTIVALLGFIISGIYLIKIPKRVDSSIRTKFPRPTFTKSEIWNNEIKSLRMNQASLESHSSSTFAQTLDQITSYIMRDFVEGWFQSISDDPTFPNQVRIQLKLAITELESRLYLLQTSNFLVLDILPLLTDHFNKFVAAEDLVLGEQRNLNRTSDIDMKISQEYGKLHKAVSIEDMDKECEVRNYSRYKSQQVIPALLNKDEQLSSAAVVLIRELLANCVLLPIIRLVSDPDFLNQTIVKLAAATLKDRDQVKELRGAIDKQYNNPGKPALIPTITKNLLLDNRINPNMRQPEFEKYMRAIDKSESLQILKQLKYYLAVQISRTHKIQSNSEKFLKYRKRLHIARDLVDERLELLGSPSIEDRRNSAVFSKDLDSFITHLSLSQVLSNPSSLSFFMEFMEQRSRTVLLQYWLTVNGIKDPLEDPKDPDYEEELSSSVDMDGSEDIKQIFNRYFDNKALKIKEDTYKEVKSFVDGTSKSLSKYIQVRKYILILQEEVFHRMEERDLPDFKNSELFLKLLSSETFEESLVNEVDLAHEPSYDEFQSDKNDISEEASIPELEAALNDIMSQEDGMQTTKPPLSKSNSTEVSPRAGSTEDLKQEIFGSSGKGFLTEKPLFEDSDDDELEECESIFSEPKLDVDSDFFSPSHVVLNLKEKISELEQEIEKLNKQNQMLDPLILKAELTNSTNDLRILKKSKASYERETEAKELQKQQLIVQDNESSLYGKTKVSIDSWVKSRSHGKDYILYVVEVQKSAEGKSGTGWIIGRRFSQFHRLHEMLKKKYQTVGLLPFPKKKVILKFQQKALIDERRLQLEYYLRKLLEIEDVCSDKEFRKFLTTQDYKISTAVSEVPTPTSTTTPRSRIEDTANKIYNGLSTSIDMLNSRASSNENLASLKDQSEESSSNSQTVGKVEDMQKELETYDLPTGGRPDSQKSFIKPVTDLLIALFSLNRPNSWLRGRAIIVVLQQIFGSTIEKHIKDLIDGLTTEERILDIITMLKDIIWPNGKFMESGIPRTNKEKSKSKQEAKILLETLMVDTCSKIVGQPSAKSASNKVFSMVQNEMLNRNLVYQILDKTLESIFPEVNEMN